VYVLWCRIDRRRIRKTGNRSLSGLGNERAGKIGGGGRVPQFYQLCADLSGVISWGFNWANPLQALGWTAAIGRHKTGVTTIRASWSSTCNTGRPYRLPYSTADCDAASGNLQERPKNILGISTKVHRLLGEQLS